MPAVGIEADMRPIGGDGVNRATDTEIQSRRAYGEAGTSVPRERVRASHPLIMRKMKAQDRVGDVNARGGSFIPFRESVSKPT